MFCGMTGAGRFLLNGEWTLAYNRNPFSPLMFPLLIVLFLISILKLLALIPTFPFRKRNNKIL